MTFFTSLYKRLRRLARELAKFGSVGAMAFVVTMECFVLFRRLGVGPLTANTIATVIATIFSYYANRYWTFQGRQDDRSTRRELVLFMILNGIGLAITQLFIGFTRYALGLEGHFEIASLVVGTGVATMFRYYAYKRWIFSAPAKKIVPTPAAYVPVQARAQVPAPVPAGVLRRPSGRPHLRQARARVVRAETVSLGELFQ